MSLLVKYTQLLKQTRLIPELKEIATGTGTGTDTFTVTPPVTPVPGNLMVIIAGGAQNRAVNTPPSGFTTVAQVGANGFTNVLFYKFATGSEPANYTIVFSAALSGGANYMEFRNCDRNAPIAFHTGAVVTTGTTLAMPTYDVTNVGVAITYFSKNNTANWVADNSFDNLSAAGESKKELRIYSAPATGQITTWTGTSATGNGDIIFFNGKILGYTI